MTEKRYNGIYAIKPWWQRQLTGIEHILVQRHVHPDLITFMGVVFAGLLAGVLAMSAHYPLLALAVIPLALGRLAANALDGLVARDRGLARPWGEALNECCDRLADIMVFVGLAMNRDVIPSLAWFVLVLALLSSYLGIAAKAAGGRRIFGGLLAKADRMIYLALFSPIVLFYGATAWNWLLIIFVPALMWTLIQRYRQAYADLQQVAERKARDERALADQSR
jgi:CDP-diacylglycerol--glycerol-3-phosphate 3-phosphatidyltransferase